MLQRKKQEGSLSKSSCLHCWLPPQENSKLCRKCSRLFLEKPQPHEVEWIRFHTTNPCDCKRYQNAIKKKEVKTHVIPEGCLYCSLFLLRNPEFIAAHIMMLRTLMWNSHDSLVKQFNTWFKENREEFFEFIVAALSILWRDEWAQKKLVNATITAAGQQRKNWVLEEITCRPDMLRHLLHSSPRIPPHLTFEFWDIFTTFEEAWTFWESMVPAAKRRIRFRCLKYKEELMARTWHPDRFLAWCSDNEERQEAWENWGIRI